jgi:hypothetical protein
MSESEQVLERFHRALIEEIQTQRPEYLTGRFTVAEIYQNLVPYGSHRDRIGVEMNGDYEDALIRLLAGEGGYLILESDPALRDLRAELETPNPNTGLYREFAAVDVRLNQEYLDLSAVAIDELPKLVEELDAQDPVSMAELAPSSSAPSPDLGIVPAGVDIFDGEPDVTPSASPAPIADGSKTVDFELDEPPPRPITDTGACAWCRATLPERDNLNFCPFCGTDLKLVPCGACGEELQPDWRFCVACGTEASG